MLKTVFCALALVASFSALAAPQEEVIYDGAGNKLPDSDVNSPNVNWELLKLRDGKAYSGIGLVDFGRGGGCTGTLIDAGASEDAPAYILTNGHCTGGSLMGPRDVLVDIPAPAAMTMKFNYFFDAGNSVRSVPVVKYSYATMKGTDIAVMQLGVSYRQLVAEGFASYKIASQESEAGTPVEMVGIPQTGIRRATRFIRRSTCTLDGQVFQLSEGGYRWNGSYRHRCSSVGGSSGTSMISRVSGKIVAINNTGVNDNAAGEAECALDRPCEVSRDGGISTNFQVNYAQRVTDIAGCFDARGVFNLNLAGCRLERP